MAIIPAFNEEKTIVQLAERIRHAVEGVDVLVVNDHSTDQTEHLLRQQGINHLALSVNLGIGGAVQSGFKYALAEGYDIALQVDGDGQHPPEQIPALLQPLLSGEADFVCGSRYLENKQNVSSRSRRLGGGLLAALIRLLTGQRVSDPTSGFRAYNHQALAVLGSIYPQDYPEPISMIELIMHGFRLREVPVQMVERQHGRSSIAGLDTLFYMIKVIFAILIARIRRTKHYAY
ncbi:MAG TPA: glycosyltransferase family 2 protein [bacterium]|nr:glycosyltransferase family 2 protein [bacterium]